MFPIDTIQDFLIISISVNSLELHYCVCILTLKVKLSWAGKHRNWWHCQSSEFGPFWFWTILSSSAVDGFWSVRQWEGAAVIWTENGCVWLCVFPACMWREGSIPFCYIMMRYWVYDLVTFLSCLTHIAFHNLIRQIFFNGNPAQGHDSHHKLWLQLFKACMHTLMNALCSMIGLKITL